MSANSRFNSVDPLRSLANIKMTGIPGGFRKLVSEIASDPQRLNLYSYVCNNPIKYLDPSGMAEVDINRVKKVTGAGWDVLVASKDVFIEALSVAGKRVESKGQRAMKQWDEIVDLNDKIIEKTEVALDKFSLHVKGEATEEEVAEAAADVFNFADSKTKQMAEKAVTGNELGSSVKKLVEKFDAFKETLSGSKPNNQSAVPSPAKDN